MTATLQGTGAARSGKAAMARLLPRLLLAYPGVMLGVFFLAPFGIMITVSFFHNVPNAFYEPGFAFDNYARFFSPLFTDRLMFSLMMSMAVAVVCVTIAFPFTYLLTRSSHRAQTLWLVLILSVLSLSEVIIAFGWSILLSRSAGLSNLLVLVGLMDRPQSWTPGLAAAMTGYVYLTLPYAVLTLYPALSRLDPQLVEAARTMGATQARAFFTVVVPACRQPIVAGLVLVFVFTLGVYLIPQILGRPQHWTLPVLITDQALFQANMPFAAALAVFLLATSLVLILFTLWLGRARAAKEV